MNQTSGVCSVSGTLGQSDAGAMSAYMRNNHKELTSITVRAATILVTIGPIILAYPFAQTYFIKGIMIGSLKG